MTPPPSEAHTTARCPHCEAPVEGTEDRFCCHGCESASALLHDLGLGDWYEQRESPGTRPELSRHAWEAVPVLVNEDGSSTILAIDGLRCTSCTWVVERVLERTEGVQDVHVSYASGRARLTFDPDVVSLRELAERIASVGYSPRPSDVSAAPDPLFANLGVALFCTANLMLFTISIYASWLDGMAERYQVLFRWLALILATPVATWSAEPFWRGAWAGLKVGRIGMDVPIALAVGVLYAHGLVQTLLGGDAYLDSLGMLVTLLLIGRIIESRGRRSTAEAAASIASHLPQVARRRTASGVEDVSPDALSVGDILELGPGTEAAADVEILDGAFQVQTALLTGETAPRVLGVGDLLLAGTTILEGSGSARVERAGEKTTAQRMADAVREAIDRPTTDNPANALAPLFTAATIGIAGIAGIIWALTTYVHNGIEVAVAVLVVACPCALGLSVPLGVSAGLGALARRGILLRDGDALLRLTEIERIALDKTGTLTLGEPTVLSAEDDVLRVAAGLERSSAHPIARAITREAVHRGIPIPLPKDVVETAGVGVEATLDDHWWSLRSGGAGRVTLYCDDAPIGSIELGDQARDDAKRAVSKLQNAGLDITILSGDVCDATQSLAKEVGISAYYGELMPTDKAEWIQKHGRVLFVGDGLNDGPALAAAHVGLAMRTGAGTSLGIADGILSRDGLTPLTAAIDGARATKHTIRMNLTRSLIYNLVAVAAAATGFVNPLVAAILMPISSAMVLIGAGSIERSLEP